MRQMYMPITQMLYEQINLKRDNGYFNDANNQFDVEKYIDFIFIAFSSYKTDKTIGYENNANIGYSLIENLKEIDIQLALILEKKLDFHYSKYIHTMKSEDLCQRFFHYGKDHLINTIEMIDKYNNSLGSNSSILPPKISEIVPTIREITSIDQHSREKIEQFVNTLNNSGIKLTSLCDSVEETMRKLFVHNLNKETQSTINEIQSNPSKLKKFDGQDFNLIIHSSQTPEDFITNAGQEYQNMLSTSLIEDANVRCYNPGNIKFAFYQNIDSETFISAFSNDASTDFSDKGLLSSFSTPDYVSMASFKDKTHQGNGLQSYSEIMLKGNVKPNAIVCYDYLTEKEYQLASKYNLDIILIDTKKYPNMLIPEISRDITFIKKVDLSIFDKEINR